jgi:4-hydroxythreonine-4-phosphate dehydrogenase
MFGLFDRNRTSPDGQKPIAISMGEPAGIGIECLFKAWQKRAALDLEPFFVIADPVNLQFQAKSLGMNINLSVIEAPAQSLQAFASALPVLPLTLKHPIEPGKPDPANASLVLESIKVAAEFALSGDVSAVVTLPIHKSTLYQSGFHFAGHTEYLASLCNSTKSTVMMLEVPGLRVALCTVHLSLKDALGKISTNLIVNNALTVDKALKNMFGIERPRLAMAALNPHAGENGALGLEEIEIIQPAVEQLVERGLRIVGPLPADTLFHKEAREQYDCALCLYHDQGLIPVKTLDFHGGVNITLGLPIVRTSPDHGTAFDIAGKGKASPESLINALRRASEIAATLGAKKSKAA